MFKLSSLLLATSILAFATPILAQDPATDTTSEATGAPAQERPPLPTIVADGDTILATVAGDDITVGHLISMRQALPDQYQSLPDDQLYPALLEQLIYRRSLATLSKEPQPKALALALENERIAIISEFAADNVPTKEITDADIQAEYDSTIGKEGPRTEYKAAHILVKTEEEGNELLVMLKENDNFAALAKEKSTGPSGPDGGDLGWFETEQMVPQFGDAVKLLKAGEISQPVETNFGWHIIKLEEIREVPPLSLDEVREQIKSQLEETAKQAALDEAIKGVKIERTEEIIDPAVVRNDALIK